MPMKEITGPPQEQWHPPRMVSSDYLLASIPLATSNGVLRVYCELRMFRWEVFI